MTTQISRRVSSQVYIIKTEKFNWTNWTFLVTAVAFKVCSWQILGNKMKNWLQMKLSYWHLYNMKQPRKTEDFRILAVRLFVDWLTGPLDEQQRIKQPPQRAIVATDHL